MLRVLTYHRVVDPKAPRFLDPGLISATAEIFNQQIAYLKKHYQVVSMGEVLDSVANGGQLPKRAVLLTFDDGYRDFGEIAWPILRHYRLPATLFVPTAYPGHPERRFWWDRLYQAIARTSLREMKGPPLGSVPLATPAERRASLRKIQKAVKTMPHGEAMELVDRICAGIGDGWVDQASVLSWDELRQLGKEGVTLGAHTRTHPIMTQLPPEAVREEITGSLSDLQREIGTGLPIFAYPSGHYDPFVVKVMKEAGIRMAFTTEDGQNDLGSADPLRLCRTNITRRTSPTLFRFRLFWAAAYLDRWRHRKLAG